MDKLQDGNKNNKKLKNMVNYLKNIQNNKIYKISVILILILLSVVFLILGLYYGGNSKTISIDDVTNFVIHQSTGDMFKDTLLKEVRFPQVFGAIAIGITLAGSGLMLQVLFRNLLASPYTTGISSGVLLMISFVIFIDSFSNLLNAFETSNVLIAGWIGGMISTVVLISIAFKVKESNSVIIIALLASYLFSGIRSYLINSAGGLAVDEYFGFVVGNLSKLTYNAVPPMAFATIIFIIASLFLIKPLNALIFGENYAKSFGLNIKKVRIVILVLTSFVVGLIIPYVGLMAFVGISAPYLARPLLRTSDNTYLLPASMLIGILLMLVCHIITLRYYLPFQLLFDIKTASVLPISAVLDVVGGLVVIYLIMQGEKKLVL
ncbi:FecCD family ABC transporter permease [Methanococcus voltae]|uniref:Transport system permease protein n=1 Tax=Methanococcus voltae (strain ATCC BAA-1334 / A3) TaxID=456320 RepID=D7DTK2_METV3|nr:iron ABC transporter permease [Methanococcus voltae]MCS3901314.1 iron complex transport system permease protein [Methanococcus voltae]